MFIKRARNLIADADYAVGRHLVAVALRHLLRNLTRKFASRSAFVRRFARRAVDRGGSNARDHGSQGLQITLVALPRNQQYRKRRLTDRGGVFKYVLRLPAKVTCFASSV